MRLAGTTVTASAPARRRPGAAACVLPCVPGDPAARVVFTDRDDGNMSLVVGGGDPVALRASAVGAVGLPPDAAVYMEQVHGGRVATVGHSERGRGAAAYADAIPGVDALVTRATDVALAVLVADCVPLVLVDPREAVAAAHAGRRGVEHGIVAATLDALRPSDPGRVQAYVGPAIGGCCYEVPAAMGAAVTALVPPAGARTSWGAPALDLATAVEAQLRAGGVTAVQRVGGCTRCAPKRYFSHRASQQGAADDGRQMAVVCRRRVENQG